MARAKVTTKGQVTIPKEIRDRLGLKPGGNVEIYIDHDGRAVIERTLRLEELAGVLPRPERPRTIDEINQGIVDAAVVRATRDL